MYTKGVINSDEFIKPLTRKEIASYLQQINDKSSELNETENELLNWYISEYYYEISRISGQKNPKTFSLLKEDAGERLRFIFYRDSLFSFYFNPSLIVDANSRYNEFHYRLSSGFSSYGSVTENFGFQIDYLDNYQYAKKYSTPYALSNETGFIVSHTNNDGYEFSETNGAATFQNDWMTLSAAKLHFNAGSGSESQLVLSSRAPSFASIYFKLNPLPWFKFYFIHGWLLSGLVDSSRSYFITDYKNTYRQVESDKYYVMHALQVNPWDNLSITLGESIIYSDRNVYAGYFIPFLFFRSVDHMFTYGKGDSGNNGSFFFDVKYRPIKNIGVYASVFLDEFSLSKFIKGSQFNNQSAYTIGGSFYTNFLNINFNTILEYTKIQPWVYSNWIPTQTYENHFYSLGHYIGQNADEVSLKLSAFFSQKFRGDISAKYIRKGGFAPVINQYDQDYQSFLYGTKMKEVIINPSLSYRFLHSFRATMHYTYTNISDEDKKRTSEFMLGVNHFFGITLLYGF